MQSRQPALVELFIESYRLRLMRGLEERLRLLGVEVVAGVDEAGRGCLAGPVVAAAVAVDLRRPCLVPGVDDSKRVGAKERERLALALRGSLAGHSIVAVPAATIDRVNVLQATRFAMSQAIERLRPRPDLVLVDAVTLDVSTPTLALIRGDSWSYAIASASVLAKTDRDRLMCELDRNYPGYGFARNKGYGALEHRQALSRLGPSPEHRLTFRSVLPRRSDANRSGSRLSVGTVH